MTFDDYQLANTRTYPPPSMKRLVSSALGLAGESGEVVELIKKQIGHGREMDTEKLCAELGDLISYVSDIATLYGLKLSTVAQTNIEKLAARYPNGFHSNPPPSGAHQPSSASAVDELSQLPSGLVPIAGRLCGDE